jgi:hypothetical protein
MIRHSLAFLVSLCLCGGASAGTWADALFEELGKDFGSVSRGPMLTHPFHLTNNTNQVVTIGGIRVSCGCTTAIALKSRLNPGESTDVVAHMDSGRFVASRTVTIFVRFDEPQFEEVRLWVRAYSRDDLILSPDNLAFGDVKHGSTPSAAATVTFLGDSQAQITGASCESSYIQPTVKELRRQDGTVAYQVSATIRPTCPPGNWYTEVWLKTGNAGVPAIRVPLSVHVEQATIAGKTSKG